MNVNQVYAVDCQQALPLLDAESVDLTVTSPPYDAIRDYHGMVPLDLSLVGKELYRVTRPGGMVVLVMGDGTVKGRKTLTTFRTTVEWCDGHGFGLWQDCLYHRSGTPGAWWNKRFRVDHEYIMVFVKGERPQVFTKDHMKVPAIQAGRVKRTGGGRKTDGTMAPSTVKAIDPWKCCGTVMDYQKASKGENFVKSVKKLHPATFPDKLAEDFILAFTTPGMLVLDPFVGSGTTARMAHKHGRKFLGFDISQEYIDNARLVLEPTLQGA